MTKHAYNRPSIEIIEVRIERGFAQSADEGVNFGVTDWGSSESFSGDAD